MELVNTLASDFIVVVVIITFNSTAMCLLHVAYRFNVVVAVLLPFFTAGFWFEAQNAVPYHSITCSGICGNGLNIDR